MTIDEMLDRAKGMVDAAARKTNEVVEISKLKYEVTKIQNELKGVYENLGREVYARKTAELEEDEICGALFDEIAALKEELDAVFETIADRQNLIICPKCGERNKMTHQFCCQCGAKLRMDPVPEEPAAPAEEAPEETCSDAGSADSEDEKTEE